MVVFGFGKFRPFFVFYFINNKTLFFNLIVLTCCKLMYFCTNKVCWFWFRNERFKESKK